MADISFDMAYVIPKNNIVALKCIFNVTLKLVARTGPGGGNPLYSATGSVEKLREFLTGFYYRDCGLTAAEIEDEINSCFPELAAVAA